MLQYQQLAESIISIKGKTPVPDHITRVLDIRERAGNIYTEYELTFDRAIQVTPAVVSFSTVYMLNKYRKSIPHLSARDHILLIPTNFDKTIDCYASSSIKQITSLFNKEILERKLDLRQYGLCHHCKRIMLLSELIKCNKIGAKSRVKHKYSKAFAKSNSKKSALKRYRKDTTKAVCPFLFCSACAKYNYDIAEETPNWTCPCCLVLLLIYRRAPATARGAKGKLRCRS
eukprot:TRINITY_DN9888_c0_g1_i7.p1 TRINITY_DN9888_c0_g1~~TRINITY_DN9888_c0_g1_i7.p1  ORF type:complete len:230 (+),score=23.11 TRINITY_DN9888_c0_g1_i7:512-1201(+)